MPFSKLQAGLGGKPFGISANVADLGRGVVWQCCTFLSESDPLPAAVEELSERIAAFAAKQHNGSHEPPSSRVVADALLHTADGLGSGPCGGPVGCGGIRVLVPESMVELDYCRWDGDGHYDARLMNKHAPPTLGQVVSFVRLVDASAEEACLTIHLSSKERSAVGAVLAGAVLVLARGLSAEAAWTELMRTCPKPDADPAKAWDRFPSPFSRSDYTQESSLRVIDCLAGLEVAVRLGWLVDYRTFDVSSWRLLRKKFDASWLIPGEVLAMGNPWYTAQNPAFPGLLDEVHESEAPEPGVSGFKGRFEAHPSTSTCCMSETSLLTDDLEFDQEEGVEEDWELSMKEGVGVQNPAQFPPLSNRLKGSVAEISTTPDLQPLKLPVLTSTWETNELNKDSFVTYLQRKGVTALARLNYDFECKEQHRYAQVFKKGGVELHEFCFDDGCIPSKAATKSFISACEKVHCQKGSCIAVHCMGGLGRTGVLVGTYAANRHHIRGADFHGWARMCRPGSVQTEAQEILLRSINSKASGILPLKKLIERVHSSSQSLY